MTEAPVRGLGDRGACVLRGVHNGLAPGAGLAGAEEDCLVDAAAHGLDDAGLDLAPDVVVGVVQHGLGDGDDDGQLFGVELFLLPGLGGSALEAGVAVHPVCQGQHVQHVDALGLAGHVGQLAPGFQDGALLHNSLKDLAGDGFRDQTRQIVSNYASAQDLYLTSASSQAPYRSLPSSVTKAHSLRCSSFFVKDPLRWALPRFQERRFF